MPLHGRATATNESAWIRLRKIPCVCWAAVTRGPSARPLRGDVVAEIERRVVVRACNVSVASTCRSSPLGATVWRAAKLGTPCERAHHRTPLKARGEVFRRQMKLGWCWGIVGGAVILPCEHTKHEERARATG